jgi:uracil-DNA glycosylase family 4
VSNAAKKLKGYLPETAFVMARRSQIKKEAIQESPAIASSVIAAGSVHLTLEGNAGSPLVFAVERSDVSAFDGKAGQLLQKMIFAMGVRHTNVLMIQVDLASVEALSEMKVALSKAQVLVTLGEPVTNYILQSEAKFSSLRGNVHPFDGIQVIPSFHPAELLAEPALKKEAWEDLKRAVKELGWTLPSKGV